MRNYFVYILASLSRRLYVGVTNDLERRIAEHKSGRCGGFTARYKINRLVHFEETPDVKVAIAREKQIKRWSRAKKVAMIETTNAGWEDLSVTVVGLSRQAPNIQQDSSLHSE